MIETRVGDIFKQPDITAVAHQCNLFHNFGAGIAKTIREEFPYAYEADCKTERADSSRIGNWIVARDPKKHGPDIINIYSQTGLSAIHRMTHYAALGKALFEIERWITLGLIGGEKETVLGLPHGIGCGLANGDWKVVEPLIFSAFEKSKFLVVICKLDPRK